MTEIRKNTGNTAHTSTNNSTNNRPFSNISGARQPACTSSFPQVLPDNAHTNMQLTGSPDLAGFEGGFAASNISACAKACSNQFSTDGWHRLACQAWTFVGAEYSPQKQSWCWLRGGRGIAAGKCGFASATCDNRPSPATDWPCCQQGFTCPDPITPP
jgi:hypothetical protein